jgi:Helicase HerA, central domain/TraM recognition site of TraD and TraG
MRKLSEFVVSLGVAFGRRPHRPFGIKTTDRLSHMAIFGQTGTGKSSLLSTMAKQDMDAGQGFCLIDPHGDLAKELAEYCGDRAIYWDVADPTCPYGYNPLTYVKPEYRPLLASGLIETLRKQWSDAWGARMEHLLRYALLALLEWPSATLADIIPLFLDSEFRTKVVANITDAHVRSFWTLEFPKMNYRTAVDGVAPIANKIGAFLAHPSVRKAVTSPERPLRFRSLMDEGRVLIVNLGKGRIGADTANVLGGLIVSAFSLAAYSRGTVRTPYFLYVDEFHAFTTSAFAGMLSELRKYGLGLMTTTQYISQLDDGVRDALFGNVGTLVSFRTGASDAGVLSREFGSAVPAPSDLIHLANYEMYLKLMINGVQSRAFSARLLPHHGTSQTTKAHYKSEPKESLEMQHISTKLLKRLVPITGLEPVTP